MSEAFARMSSAACSVLAMAANSTMPAAPFERMEGPECAVQPFPVAGFLLKRHQIVDRLGDEFPRFEKKLFDEFVHRGAPQKMAAYSASVSCLIGFTR